MKQYNYKVVGVTFPARDGSDRQKTLRELWNEDVELDNSSHAVRLEGYEFEGAGALAVLLDGREIGNIPADKVQDVVEIGQKADACDVTLTLNGRDFEDAQDIIDTYKNRKQYVKDGTIHELELDDVEEAYQELMGEHPTFGAVLHFMIKEPEDIEREKRIQEKIEAEKNAEEPKEKKQPSAASLKATFILSIVLIILSLLVLIVSPVAGILGIAIGIWLIVKSRKGLKGTTGQKDK